MRNCRRLWRKERGREGGREGGREEEEEEEEEERFLFDDCGAQSISDLTPEGLWRQHNWSLVVDGKERQSLILENSTTT